MRNSERLDDFISLPLLRLTVQEIPWLQLTVLLTVATASHFAFRRFQIPTIVGEIFIGVVLGPTAIGYLLGEGFWDPTFTGIFSALGAIILLFVIGLDSDLREIYSKRNLAIAAGGVVLPFLAGFFLAEVMLPDQPLAVKVFVGATLVATSVAVTAAVLLELNALRTDVAKTIIGAAVVDDVLGLIVLSVSIGLAHGTLNTTNLVLLTATALLFLGAGAFIGIRYFNRLVNWAERKGQHYGLKHTGFTLGLGLTFLYAFLANYAGLNPIVGAFLAGATFSKSELTQDFQLGAEYLGAIFTPIFFVSLGLQVNLRMLDSGLALFGLALVAVAIASKVVGCWIPAELSKMSRGKSIAVGIGMAPRGEVGLVIASTALGLAVISPGLYSITVLVIVLTTVIPPPMFKRCLRRAIREDLEERLVKPEMRG